jgi:hypothetical protein
MCMPIMPIHTNVIHSIICHNISEIQVPQQAYMCNMARTSPDPPPDTYICRPKPETQEPRTYTTPTPEDPHIS